MNDWALTIESVIDSPPRVKLYVDNVKIYDSYEAVSTVRRVSFE